MTYTVNKLTACSAVDFAAEELRKYLRMMDPTAVVRIAYDPSAKDGFRLGLMQELGLDVSDVSDPLLDDLLYVDTDETGGVIAGDNPRSVLLAVYEYLRQNGCRWLFPGIDGEEIPLCSPVPVRLRHAPSCRYRGPCIEGATSQTVLLETIDFLPKVGMNVFMFQFFTPTVFYSRYYGHQNNPARTPEPIDDATMRQWKIACECEIEKRGLQLHDVGHGFTVAPFGVDISAGWKPIDDSALPEDARKYLALLGGERKLFKGVALNTQFCMSSPEARRRVAAYVADYAEAHPSVDYIHVWLGDSHNNHCECAECVRHTVSDLYVTLLNDIDEALTEKGLTTRIVFIAYTETTFAPTAETLRSPDRFTLMLAPISRSYTRTMTDAKPPLPAFERNNVTLPKDLDAYMAHFDEWRKSFKGAALSYEYHFWKHQIFDPSGLFLARRIFEDVEAYRARGVNGLIACGSQRSYFPTGFAYYVFARKQFDLSLSFEEIRKDYFDAAFGNASETALAYLSAVAETFGEHYMEGEETDSADSPRYRSSLRAACLRTFAERTKESRSALEALPVPSRRVASVSRALLLEHADYCALLSELLAYKAEGRSEDAAEALDRFVTEMGRRELALERYFDLDLAVTHLRRIVRA